MTLNSKSKVKLNGPQELSHRIVLFLLPQVVVFLAIVHPIPPSNSIQHYNYRALEHLTLPLCTHALCEENKSLLPLLALTYPL